MDAAIARGRGGRGELGRRGCGRRWMFGGGGGGGGDRERGEWAEERRGRKLGIEKSGGGSWSVIDEDWIIGARRTRLREGAGALGDG
jgi:hypothetical protein